MDSCDDIHCIASSVRNKAAFMKAIAPPQIGIFYKQIPCAVYDL